MLKRWLDAQEAVAMGQSYSIAGRSLTRASLPDILRMIQYWQDVVEALETNTSPGIRTRRVVPRDL